LFNNHTFYDPENTRFINKLVFAAALAALLSAAAFAAPDFTAKPAEAAQKAAPDTAQPVEAVQPPAAVQPLAAGRTTARGNASSPAGAGHRGVRRGKRTGRENSPQRRNRPGARGLQGLAVAGIARLPVEHSQEILRRPVAVEKIYLANQNQIKDPRLIYPRQELIIPPKDEPEKQ